jgi:hypothetical protein
LIVIAAASLVVAGALAGALTWAFAGSSKHHSSTRLTPLAAGSLAARSSAAPATRTFGTLVGRTAATAQSAAASVGGLSAPGQAPVASVAPVIPRSSVAPSVQSVGSLVAHTAASAQAVPTIVVGNSAAGPAIPNATLGLSARGTAFPNAARVVGPLRPNASASPASSSKY